MRTTLLAPAAFALVASLAAPAAAESLVPLAPPVGRALSHAEIEAEVQPHAPAIARCYLGATGDVRGAGQLELRLDIHRIGVVDAIAVHTPGLSSRQARQIERCVRRVVADVSFPPRRTSTTATVPFFYQRTAAPDAGPQPSCWNPRGCR